MLDLDWSPVWCVDQQILCYVTFLASLLTGVKSIYIPDKIIRKEETTGFFILLSRENEPLSPDNKMIIFHDLKIQNEKRQ